MELVARFCTLGPGRRANDGDCCCLPAQLNGVVAGFASTAAAATTAPARSANKGARRWSRGCFAKEAVVLQRVPVAGRRTLINRHVVKASRLLTF